MHVSIRQGRSPILGPSARDAILPRFAVVAVLGALTVVLDVRLVRGHD